MGSYSARLSFVLFCRGTKLPGKEEAAAGLHTQNGVGRVSQAPVEGVSLCSASGLCRKAKNMVGEKTSTAYQPSSSPPCLAPPTAPCQPSCQHGLAPYLGDNSP